MCEADVRCYFDYVLPLVLQSGKASIINLDEDDSPCRPIMLPIEMPKTLPLFLHDDSDVEAQVSAALATRPRLVRRVRSAMEFPGSGPSAARGRKDQSGFCENVVLLEAKDVKPEIKNNDIWDLVTTYDRKIEEILIAKIKQRYPTHKFIGEEESAAKDSISKLTDDPTWIIDPIDGTANFVRKLPISCVSVGLTIKKEQVMGIVYNPYMDEVYTAIRGQGAFLNGEQIFTSGLEDLRKSVLCYELSLARVNPYYYNLYMYRLKHLIKEILGIRSFGSAVMGLCYVANGRLDAYQCDGLYPWDAAAATLIVREAGGYIADTTGKEFDLMDPNYIATATKTLSDQYLAIEREADDELLNNAKNKNEFCP